MVAIDGVIERAFAELEAVDVVDQKSAINLAKHLFLLVRFQKPSLDFLLRVSSKDEWKKTLITEDLSKACIQLLVESSEEDGVATLAVGLIANIANLGPDVLSVYGESALIAKLLSLIGSANCSVELLRHGTRALHNLSQVLSMEAKKDALATTIKLCSSCHDPQVLGHAAAVLSTLVDNEDDSLTRLMLDAAVVNSMLQLVIRHHQAVSHQQAVSHACQTIANLASSNIVYANSQSAEMITRQAVAPILNVCRSSSDTLVLSSALAALSALGKHESGKEVLVREDSEELLVRLCTDAQDSAVLSHAASALSCLSGDTALSTPVEKLIQLCESATDAALLQKAVQALANMAQNPTSASQMVTQNGVAPLMRICKEQKGLELVQAASVAVLNLVSHEDNERQVNHVVSNDGAKVVVSLLQFANTSVQQNAIQTIGKLAAHPKIIPRLLSSDHFVIRPLITLCRDSPSRLVKAACARTFNEFARHASSRPQLAQLGAILQLVTLLGAGMVSRHTNGDMQGLNVKENALCHEHASTALHTLSRVEEYRAQLVSDGALKKLTALVRVGQTKHHRAALSSTKCLANLMLDESAAKKVLDERADGEQILLVGILDMCVDPKAVAMSDSVSNPANEQPAELPLYLLDVVANMANHRSIVETLLVQRHHRIFTDLMRICQNTVGSVNTQWLILAKAAAALGNLALHRHARHHMLSYDDAALLSALVKVCTTCQGSGGKASPKRSSLGDMIAKVSVASPNKDVAISRNQRIAMREVCKAIANLSAQEKSQMLMVRKGVATLFVKFCISNCASKDHSSGSGGADKVVLLYATQAIANICSEPTACKDVGRLEAVEGLTAVLRELQNQKAAPVFNHTARALCALAEAHVVPQQRQQNTFGADQMARLCGCGGIHMIVDSLKQQGPHTTMLFMRCLAAASDNDVHKGTLMDARAVQAVVRTVAAFNDDNDLDAGAYEDLESLESHLLNARPAVKKKRPLVSPNYRIIRDTFGRFASDENCSVILTEAARLLRNVSRTEAHRVAVIEAGAVPWLIRLSGSSSQTTQRSSIEALAHVSSCIQLLEQRFAGDQAASAEGSRTSESDSCDEHHGSSSLLPASSVVVINSATLRQFWHGMAYAAALICEESTDPTCLCNASAALRNLSRIESYRQFLVRNGVAKVLVQLAANSNPAVEIGGQAGMNSLRAQQSRTRAVCLRQMEESKTILGFSRGSILNLALCSRATHCTGLAMVGAVDLLCRLLQTFTGADGRIASASLNSLQLLVEALANLSSAISPSNSRQNHSRSLNSPAADRQIQHPLGDIAARRALLDRIGQSVGQLMAHGGTNLPAYIAASFIDSEVALHHICRAIAHIAMDDRCAHLLQVHGVIECLVSLCRHPQAGCSVSILRELAHTTRNLSRHNPCRVALVKAGMCCPLVLVCRSSSDAVVVSRCCATIANLSLFEWQFQQQQQQAKAERAVGVVESGVVAAGGIELLLSFCTRTAGGIAAGKDDLIGIRGPGLSVGDSRSCDENREREESLGFVVSAIRNLAMSEAARIQLLSGGAIAPLIHLIEAIVDKVSVQVDSHTNTKTHVPSVLKSSVDAVRLITRHEGCRQLFMKVGAGKALCKLLGIGTPLLNIVVPDAQTTQQPEWKHNQAGLVVASPLDGSFTITPSIYLATNPQSESAAHQWWANGQHQQVMTHLGVMTYSTAAVANLALHESNRSSLVLLGLSRPFAQLLALADRAWSQFRDRWSAGWLAITRDAQVEKQHTTKQHRNDQYENEQCSKHHQRHDIAKAWDDHTELQNVNHEAKSTAGESTKQEQEKAAVHQLRKLQQNSIEMQAALNEQLDSLIELSTYCCAALRNLARHEESRGIIVQDGAVRVLVRAYNNSAGSSMTSVLRAAITDWTQQKIIFNQSIRIKRPEDLDPVEEKKQQQKLILGNVDKKLAAVRRLKTYASEALLNLALHQPSADRLVQEGVAGPLVSMITSHEAMKYEPNAGGGTSTTATKSVEKRHMVNAAGTLAHLARHERIKPVLVQRGAVEPLCELCRSTDLDPRVKCNAMLALSRLAVPRKTHLESRAGMATLVLTALIEGRKGFGAFHNAVPLILQQPLKEALAALQSSKEDEIKFTF